MHVRTPSGFGKRDPTNLLHIALATTHQKPGLFTGESCVQGPFGTATDPSTWAWLLAVCRWETGALLHALLMSSLGLRMDSEVIHVAKGLHHGVLLCHPHVHQLCGAGVGSLGTHGLHCSKSLGNHHHHWAGNDVVKTFLASAKIAAQLELAGICEQIESGRMVLPSCHGKVVICPDTFAPSHQQLAEVCGASCHTPLCLCSGRDNRIL